MRPAIIGLLGVLPAFFLCSFAALALFVSAWLLVVDDHWVGLVLVVWAIAGIWGAVALLRAALGHPTTTIRFGLYTGMAAIMPLLISAALDPGLNSSPLLLTISAGPFLVAAYLLVEMTIDHLLQNADVEEAAG